ncbi:MAG: hypothetical protein M1368_11540 [Thaumarchaeota archaeon]|nr:hypothetical protein [Nitrososphaerota archaeon]
MPTGQWASPDSTNMSSENTSYAPATRESQQQVMSVEFDITVKDWWIAGGRLVIPKEYRQYFPKPGESENPGEPNN